MASEDVEKGTPIRCRRVHGASTCYTHGQLIKKEKVQLLGNSVYK